MEALPLRTNRTNCVTNIQQDVEQTLAIIASMMQHAAHDDATLYCALTVSAISSQEGAISSQEGAC
jgi:hypothetical protein